MKDKEKVQRCTKCGKVIGTRKKVESGLCTFHRNQKYYRKDDSLKTSEVKHG